MSICKSANVLIKVVEDVISNGSPAIAVIPVVGVMHGEVAG